MSLTAYDFKGILVMNWIVTLHSEFKAEFNTLRGDVQKELLAHATLLERFGPGLGRPHVDTLNGSKYSNMKELRFQADDGVWRVAFAFDTKRNGILLIAGDKSGVSQKRFYKELIRKADYRFTEHLSLLEE
jgi:hypothetical protein